MQHNPEIELLVENASNLAKDLRHQYVLTEHLLLAMVQHQPFAKVLADYGVDVALLENEISTYLAGQTSIVVKDSNDYRPQRTNSLERIFNRANVQVMFTGRRTMNIIDLFLSIMAESNSHAHYFLLRHGVKKAEFVEFFGKNYQQTESQMRFQQRTSLWIVTGRCTFIRFSLCGTTVS